MTGWRPFAAASLLLAGTASASRADQAPLRIRASSAVAPCVAPATLHFRISGASVETGGYRDLAGADVFVGADVEVTRALESGAAVIGSEADIASIPWVLAVEPGNPLHLRGTADLARDGFEVWVLGGVAASQARRSLGHLAPERLKESEDPRLLRAAAVALVPLSLAGRGERLSVDVPALVAKAAVAEGSRRPDTARAFVSFLASEPGQRAFAACGAEAR